MSETIQAFYSQRLRTWTLGTAADESIRRRMEIGVPVSETWSELRVC